MLRKKMLRDVLNNKSQFITILLMVMIGVMVYAGIEGYMAGMTKTADKFYTKNNLQDINVIGSGFTKDDLEHIKKIDGVNNAERKLELVMTNSQDEDKSSLFLSLKKMKLVNFMFKTVVLLIQIKRVFG